MRLYNASDEESVRTRRLLKDWAGMGFLTEAQHQRMEKETVLELRTTNIFLRVVLFLFTVVIVGAAAALFFVTVLQGQSAQTSGVFLLVFAAVLYAAAEFAASQGRLYRFGIEEALAGCSVGFLCVGMQGAFFGRGYSPLEFLVPAAGAVLSLWIWRRFGLWYAFLAAMIFAVNVPGYWTSSHAAQHVMVAAFYAMGLASVVAVPSRHRFDYFKDSYSLAEALLWLGIYLAINLQLSSLNLLSQWRLWGTHPAAAPSEFPRPFYWITWVLIWCLPPIVLARGIRQKDRFVMAVGAAAAILTFISNKPYLGWQRRTWDPMLLGILLTGVALLIRRWLARGPNGIRRGFTAARLSEKDKQWMNAGTIAFGVLSPQPITPNPQPSSPEAHFGGGDSGGAGASSDF